jgi:hypothetical protein
LLWVAPVAVAARSLTVDEQAPVAVEIRTLAIQIAVRSLRLAEPGGVHSLSDLRATRDMMEDLEIMIVQHLRQTGTTWKEIAETLGVTRQTAHYRLSKRITQWVNSARDNHARLGYNRSLVRGYRNNIDLLHQLVDELSPGKTGDLG